MTKNRIANCPALNGWPVWFLIARYDNVVTPDAIGVADTLRPSGFVDEAMAEESETQESSSLIGIVGFTVRQILQIVVPLLITLRVLKTTRKRSRRKRPIVA